MKLLITVMIGLVLVVSSPAQNKGQAPPKQEREYAKVELKGTLDVTSFPGAPGPLLRIGPDVFSLDVSDHKELQGDVLRKMDGMTVIVTGALKPGHNPRQALRVLVSSFHPVVVEQ